MAGGGRAGGGPPGARGVSAWDWERGSKTRRCRKGKENPC